jgi:exonuclease III
MLSKIFKKKKKQECILLGDFNVCFQKINDAKYRQRKSLGPTHQTGASRKSQLDHCYTNYPKRTKMLKNKEETEENHNILIFQRTIKN